MSWLFEGIAVFIVEVVIEIVIVGTGRLLLAPFPRGFWHQSPGPFIVGILFWFAIIIAAVFTLF